MPPVAGPIAVTEMRRECVIATRWSRSTVSRGRGRTFESQTARLIRRAAHSRSPASVLSAYSLDTAPQRSSPRWWRRSRTILPNTRVRPCDSRRTVSSSFQRGAGFEITVWFVASRGGVILIYYPRCEALSEDRDRWSFGDIATRYKWDSSSFGGESGPGGVTTRRPASPVAWDRRQAS